MSVEDTTIKSKVSLEIFELINNIHFQHGLKHTDYNHYHNYCTLRLRRIRKVLKFNNGKGKYNKKNLPEKIEDARYLELILINAERAWALAMELKELYQQDIQLNGRVKFHARSRLAKAANYSGQLVKLAHQFANPTTALEAEAYDATMKGSLSLDKENWNDSLTSFVRAQTVFEQLAKVGELEQQAIFREKGEQLENNIRLCKYKRDRMASTSADSLADIKDIRAGLDDVLRSKLDSVIQETRSKQAEGLDKITFGSNSIPLKNKKARVLFVSINDMIFEMEEKKNLPSENKIDQFNVLFQYYDDVTSLLKQELRELQQLDNKSAKISIQEENINSLCDYVTFQKTQFTLQRNELLAQGLVEQWDKREEQGEDKKSKVVKSDHLVHIFEIMIQNIEVILKFKESLDPLLVVKFTSQLHKYSGYRCYYLSQSYSTVNQYLEAYALLQRSSEWINMAMQTYQERPGTFAVELEDLKKFQDKIVSEKSIIHASLNYSESNPVSQSSSYLMDRLDSFEVVESSAQFKLISFPPQLEAMPNKPVFFDLASHSISFNSLDKRMKKTGGFFSSLLGGGK